MVLLRWWTEHTSYFILHDFILCQLYERACGRILWKTRDTFRSQIFERQWHVGQPNSSNCITEFYDQIGSDDPFKTASNCSTKHDKCAKKNKKSRHELCIETFVMFDGVGWNHPQQFSTSIRHVMATCLIPIAGERIVAHFRGNITSKHIWVFCIFKKRHWLDEKYYAKRLLRRSIIMRVTPFQCWARKWFENALHFRFARCSLTSTKEPNYMTA